MIPDWEMPLSVPPSKLLLLPLLLLTLPLASLGQTATTSAAATTAAVPTIDYVVSGEAAARRPSVAAAQLDIAERMAAELSGWTSELAESSANLTQQHLREVKFARGALALIRDIGNFSKKLSIGASLLNFVASLLLNSETEVLAGAMLRRFHEVNQKLNGLQRQLDKATSRLVVLQESSEALRPYRDCHDAVRNGDQKLSQTLRGMEAARTKHQLSRLAEEFTSWYVTSELDSRLLNLHRAATRESSPNLGKNMFHAYAELHDCSTSQLINLMLGVVHDLERGAELQLAYQFFRNGHDRANEQFNRARSDLYQLRAAFDRRYWYCLENTGVVAANVIRKLLLETASMRLAYIAGHVTAGLERHFHRFNWAVAVGASELLPNSTLEPGNFFHLPTTPRVLVLFSDSEQVLRCSDANFTSARLFFHCPPSTCAVAASLGTIGSRLCPGVAVAGAENADWFASTLAGREALCPSPSTCNGHGTCHSQAGLTRPVCQCEPEYQGDRCAIRDNATAVSAKLIADLRDSVREFASEGEFVGVSTTVDVYYQLLDVKTTLIRELRGLTACTDLGTLINSDIIREAFYMTETYGQLLKGQRTLDQFGELMQTRIGGRNLDLFLKSLLDRLLGTNPFGLPGRGIVHLFKRCLAVEHHQVACSERYADSVQRFMTSLAVLDESVGESLLTYFSWKRDRVTPADKLVITYLVTEYKNRTAQFRNHWQSQSCPALMSPGQPIGSGLATWNQRFCNAAHSYEGLVLNVTCGGLRRPQTAQIACIRDAGGRLTWSPEPRCEPEWAPWSQWSECSVTCGNGRQSRSRCLGEDCRRRQMNTQPCARFDCCSMQFGEGNFFRCRFWAAPGQCVAKHRVCDDVSDCTDGSDETACDNVRAGQPISLQSMQSPEYSLWCPCCNSLGCPCPFLNGVCKCPCTMRYCGLRKPLCPNEFSQFKIYSPGRGPGDSILSGDVIGLMSDWHTRTWLSCTWHERDSLELFLRNCPRRDVSRVNSACGGEKFIIYSVEDTGRWLGQANRVGRRIRCGERVVLFHPSYPSGWLSSMLNFVKLRKTTRDNKTNCQTGGCPNEVFRIYN